MLISHSHEDRAGGPSVRLGLHVEHHITKPGIVELPPAATHRVRVHIGTPVRGTCGLESFRYTRGDLDILPAGYGDVWQQQDATTSLMVAVPPQFIQRAAEDMGLRPDRVGLDLRHQFRDPQIEHIARALDTNRTGEHPSGLLYEESLGLALAVRLLGRASFAGETGPKQRGLSRPQLRRVIDFVEAHLDERLSLTRLAVVAGTSASHLKTLFKRSTGVPVHEYVVQRRVERARQLLLRGDLPASQVALDSGFSHQSHMARCMRRVLGLTPSVIQARTP